MKKPLYIDNDILPFEFKEDVARINGFKPDSDSWDYDKFVSEKLKRELPQYNECDCIVLPYALDSGRYADYLGLVVAMHIRLTPEWGFCEIPIVFVGPDPVEQVAKISKYGSLLFTPMVFTTSSKNISELEFFLEELSRNTDGYKMSYQDFLDRIKVVPPAMFDSRHSIANEWCRYRWMGAIGKSYDTIIKDQLYFKYCEMVGEFHQSKTVDNKPLHDKVNNGEGVIMLVDDEAEKWTSFFTGILESPEDGHFVVIGDNYKNYNRRDCISNAIEAIKTINPDVVLLDLRLCEEDSHEMDRKNLTGNAIVEKIKNINKGIQVVAFSASNKDDSYRGFSYDDVIVKESPENLIEEDGINKKIHELITSLSEGLIKAKFLKK